MFTSGRGAKSCGEGEAGSSRRARRLRWRQPGLSAWFQGPDSGDQTLASQILHIAVQSFFKKIFVCSIFLFIKEIHFLMPGFNRKANGDVVGNFKQTSGMTELFLERELATAWYSRAGEACG